MLRWSLKTWCLVIALIGLVGFVEGCTKSSDDRAFARHGRKVMSEVVHDVKQTTYTKHGQTTGVAYRADIPFKTESGQLELAQGIAVDAYMLDELRAGRRLELEYIPEHPDKVRLASASQTSSSQTWIGLPMLIVGGVAFWLAPRRR